MPDNEIGNLFDNLPDVVRQELVATVLRAGGLRIERIVSQGQASPPGFWYNQEESEWVIVLEGQAAVQFEGQTAAVEFRRRLVCEYPRPREASGCLDGSGPENGLVGDLLPSLKNLV